MTARGRGRLYVLGLALLVLAGWALRLERGRRGLPYLHHWDEPFLANRAIAMAQTGDPDPRFFNYGSLRIYLDVPAVAAARAWLERRPAGHPERLDPATGVRFRGAPEDPLRRRAAGLPPWWISHPTLLRACRAVSALHGALAIVLAAALARRLDGRLAALGAAALLAFDPAHVVHSSLATVDVLAATTALLVLVATQRFADLGRPRDLALASLAVGLTASAKYNVAIVGLAPAAALAADLARAGAPERRQRAKWLALGPLLALAAFAATSPYFFVEPARAAGHLRRMAGTYLGEETAAIGRGLPHLAADLAELARHLSAPVVLLALTGVVALARRRRGGALLIAAVALLVLNAATRTDYHRNLLLLYPLAAIAGGAGLAAVARVVRGLLPGPARPRRHALVAALLLAALAAPLAARAAGRVRAAVAPPPRSLVIDALARQPHLARRTVAVAAELGLHPIDRARWPGRLVARPLAEIACAPGAAAAVIVPREVAWRSAAHRAGGERLRAVLASFGETLWAAGSAPFTPDRPSAFAGVALRRPPPGPVDPALCPPAHPGGAPPGPGR